MSSRDDIKLNSIEKLNLVKQRRILLESVALNSKAIANALSTLKIPALDGIDSGYVKALTGSITNIDPVGISSSAIANIASAGISSSLASSFQQSINSAALSSSTMASALGTLKISALDGIHSRYIKALNESITNIASIGISSSLASSFQQSINSAALSSSAMASALGTLKISALDGIHSRYVKALNESIANIASAGISSSLASSFQQISDCMNNIKIKDIRINNDGTINYYGRDINMDETIEEFDSILEEDSSIERKIHEKSDSSNPIMIIMLFLFFIIPITNIFNQSRNILKDNNINYEISESIDKLNENIVYKLDKVADILEYILIYGEKTIDYCENFYKEYPLKSNLIIFLISEVYQFIKKKIKNIEYRKKVIEDKKRTIKFIKKEVITLVKNEFKNPIINNLVKNNFGLVISKNVEVRTNNTVKSPIVYKIKNIGEVVIILEKRRNWTRIKFDGEDNKTYIGWVFTRYISKVNS